MFFWRTSHTPLPRFRAFFLRTDWDDSSCVSKLEHKNLLPRHGKQKVTCPTWRQRHVSRLVPLRYVFHVPSQWEVFLNFCLRRIGRKSLKTNQFTPEGKYLRPFENGRWSYILFVSAFFFNVRLQGCIDVYLKLMVMTFRGQRQHNHLQEQTSFIVFITANHPATHKELHHKHHQQVSNKYSSTCHESLIT